jgi:hypothetical protein
MFSGVPMMVSGKKKMICIDLNSSNDGNGGGSKIIELRGPRARKMYVNVVVVLRVDEHWLIDRLIDWLIDRLID